MRTDRRVDRRGATDHGTRRPHGDVRQPGHDGATHISIYDSRYDTYYIHYRRVCIYVYCSLYLDAYGLTDDQYYMMRDRYCNERVSLTLIRFMTE